MGGGVRARVFRRDLREHPGAHYEKAGGKALAGAGGKAVLLTEPTRFAAEKLVESFQECRMWSRMSILNVDSLHGHLPLAENASTRSRLK